ncbi:hypothetical protein ACX80S_18700 [Arthrobacter sp. RHLT1-20]
MSGIYLSIHVVAVILTIGPVTVAASMFPRAARSTLTGPSDRGSLAALHLLHRICRTYSILGIFVPAFGVVTALSMGILMSPWLWMSIILTSAAAAILTGFILPSQRKIVSALAQGDELPTSSLRLSMATGLFSLVWLVVTVLMILRPGSTTGP